LKPNFAIKALTKKKSNKILKNPKGKS
jgi:hypothetical protein